MSIPDYFVFVCNAVYYLVSCYPDDGFSDICVQHMSGDFHEYC